MSEDPKVSAEYARGAKDVAALISKRVQDDGMAMAGHVVSEAGVALCDVLDMELARLKAEAEKARAAAPLLGENLG